jgi:hypothetical protein
VGSESLSSLDGSNMKKLYISVEINLVDPEIAFVFKR